MLAALRSRLALFVRWRLPDFIFRLEDAIRGHNFAEWRRLTKAGRISVGPHTYLWPTVRAFPPNDTKLIIGSYSSLSENALVMLGGNHGPERVTTFALRPKWDLEGAEDYPLPTGDTYIGSDVWLTERTLVRSGVRIGDGAVIAAGAVVTKDVPPFAIVGGNPARLIRYRHTPEQIKALLEIKWWDWPDSDVLDAVPLLEGTDVDAFIDWARANKSHLVRGSDVPSIGDI